MPVNCDVILQWGATPAELKALGAAFWRWGDRKAGGASVYQCLDSQALADLIAGQFPLSSQPPWPADRRGVHFWVRDEASRDRQETIDRLRRDIPPAGVEDILVDGASWARVGSKGQTEYS